MASLSDPSSRRRLGTQSGAMRREARRIERDGGNPTRLLEAAASQKLNEGSAISSAKGNAKRDEFSRRLEQGLARQSLATMTRGSAADPATSPTPSSQPSLTRSSGTPSSQPSLTRSGGTPAVAVPKTSLNPTYDSDGNGIPNSIQRPASSPQGRINGRPAGTVLKEMRDNPTYSLVYEKGAEEKFEKDRLDAVRKDPSYRNSFSADLARDNLDEMGVSGAVEDYQRRSRENPSYVPSPATPKSPLQQAIDDAKNRRTPPAFDNGDIVAQDPSELAGPPISARTPAEPMGPPLSARTPELIRPRPQPTLTTRDAMETERRDSNNADLDRRWNETRRAKKAANDAITVPRWAEGSAFGSVLRGIQRQY